LGVGAKGGKPPLRVGGGGGEAPPVRKAEGLR